MNDEDFVILYKKYKIEVDAKRMHPNNLYYSLGASVGDFIDPSNTDRQICRECAMDENDSWLNDGSEDHPSTEGDVIYDPVPDDTPSSYCWRCAEFIDSEFERCK